MGGGGADNGRDAVVSSGGDVGKAGRARWRDCCRFPMISRELRRPPIQSPVYVQCW